MKIKLIDIGRSKVNKIVDVQGYTGILDEVSKYLMSSNVYLSRDDESPELITVNAGFHTVGKVEILDSRMTVGDILNDSDIKI